MFTRYIKRRLNQAWSFYKVAILNAMAYRGPLLIWSFQSILGFITIVFVWISATAGREIGGYTKPELITYYLILLFLENIIGWYCFWSVRGDIKDGDIVNVLAKPISYFWRWIGSEAAWHSVSFSINFVINLTLVFIFRNYFVFSLDFSRGLLMIPVIAMATLIVFTLNLCMGLLAFWFTEVSSVNHLYWVSILLLGGQGIPISFLPGKILLLAKIFPFRYIYSFPLEIYFNQVSQKEIFLNLGIQLFWFLILLRTYKLMWKYGLRTYTAFGR